ncbi:molybdopterin oxidoreductase family protein [Sulfurirhabdus autotrophica]|uniref:Anaerobic selenocysteine-containing dehydrogenase n=1 Tax=Sulfurirhabdus autotrophica TaxID=1706046 RepID=A0A4R3XTL1_9PROT|nr:molybdopterin oxidoreductase family protein [Sulfurirhabdus autotrophica]TCV82536.1 anaerobic selenocysteine-containing dehydrogenase [Sulfurirhabdus autotrophica]
MNAIVKTENHDKQEIKFSTCYMCACRCGIKVTMEDNKVRFIQGNRNHPTNQGVLCAKGSAGIMKQYSAAKLSKPLLRKPGSERGDGEFEEIEWDQALDMLTERLEEIRSTNPSKLGFFTGRDQMQALTGLWAQQFGTPNWSAHGGFCSVNMAAAGLYSIGFSFWEFGAPDWDFAKYFIMWGVAEDHSSNPIKIGLEKLKRHGGKFVTVNPVRTGYSAIADEWVPIKPGMDGLLALSMVHVLLSRELFDYDFLVRYTNSPWLVVQTPGQVGDGLFLRDENDVPLVWDLEKEVFVSGMEVGTSPALFGEFVAPDGRKVKTVLSMTAERYLDDRYAPENVANEVGVPAETIEKIALEMAHVAFKEEVVLDIEWTDIYGRKHDKVIGRPVAMYAMRGIAAHSNGFHACRALHLIQMLLGALDGPGNFRARAPYPKPIPPHQLPENNIDIINAPNTPLSRPPLGFPTRPEDLVIDHNGNPLRIDKAYSWEIPIASHGLMHMVITNATNHDPYALDTLILFMANMAWNSTMNTKNVQEMLREKDPEEPDQYKIPFLVVADAFHSEMVNFADLVLPDTTYLERYDTISLLDRPISEPDSAADAIRHPLVALDRDVRPWQDVLVELASRLKFPAFTTKEGDRKFKDYKDFIVNYERSPGVGFLAGWRGKNGEKSLKGEPNPNQWEKYIENESFFAHHWPDNMKYMRYANKDYLEVAADVGFVGKAEPIIMQIYSEPLQKFRLAGQGLYDGPQPNNPVDRERLAKYFDPLPMWYEPLESTRVDHVEYPFYALTQRPMLMYHSWDSQNVWLRQLLAQNYMYMNAGQAARMGLKDYDWIWVESHNGKIRCQMKTMEGCQENTIWTWNAIGKQKGAWGLKPDASEATKGFLLNHLISELLPAKQGERRITNSDPVTGQAAWFDLRVKIYKAAEGETGSWPEFAEIKRIPGDDAERPNVLRYNARSDE